MNSNAQVDVDYKFRMAHVFDIVKELISTSENEEDKEVSNKVKEIEKKQDNEYLKNLENGLKIHGVTDKRSGTRDSDKKVKVSDTVKENTILNNKEVILDEEKDR